MRGRSFVPVTCSMLWSSRVFIVPLLSVACATGYVVIALLKVYMYLCYYSFCHPINASFRWKVQWILRIAERFLFTLKSFYAVPSTRCFIYCCCTGCLSSPSQPRCSAMVSSTASAQPATLGRYYTPKGVISPLAYIWTQQG